MPTTDAADNPEDRAPDTPAETSRAIPEQRGEPRFRVQWHAAASFDGHHVFAGYTKDLSIKGATLYLDHNPEKAKSVSLRIQVPPLSEGAPPHVVDVEGRVVYAIHDSEEQLFRAGIHFNRFIKDSDRDFLESRLQSYPQTRADRPGDYA